MVNAYLLTRRRYLAVGWDRKRETSQAFDTESILVLNPDMCPDCRTDTGSEFQKGRGRLRRWHRVAFSENQQWTLRFPGLLDVKIFLVNSMQTACKSKKVKKRRPSAVTNNTTFALGSKVTWNQQTLKGAEIPQVPSAKSC